MENNAGVKGADVMKAKAAEKTATRKRAINRLANKVKELFK